MCFAKPVLLSQALQYSLRVTQLAYTSPNWWQPFSQLLWLECADFVKAVVKLLGEMKMLLAVQYKVVSKILQLHILLATRALTPQSPYQLHHYFRRTLYTVNAVFTVTTTASAHTTTTHASCVQQSNPCRSFSHTRSAEVDDSECSYS